MPKFLSLAHELVGCVDAGRSRERLDDVRRRKPEKLVRAADLHLGQQALPFVCGHATRFADRLHPWWHAGSHESAREAPPT